MSNKLQNKGIGDFVELLTTYTGIKWLVKKVVGEDCGCDERKEFLNRITPRFLQRKKVNKGKPELLRKPNNIKGISDRPRNGSIFVQIAAYRDPELRSTINDLLRKAANPARLHICIAWQHAEEDSWDNLKKYQKDDRFTILDFDYKESEGVCWARNQIQQHYRGEDYTLQLDSHHRFVKNWDMLLIQAVEELQRKGHEKPLITGYLPSYDPTNDPEGRVTAPWRMNYDRFSPDGNVHFLPATIDDFEKYKEPIPARFYSAHFAFTLGIFTQEVQHDPNMYFHGEEMTIAVRAFTHGYDLFHPNKIYAWHEYTRENQKKHWDDHDNWGGKNTIAHARLRQLLGVDGTPCTPCNKKSFGKYYLGEQRTVQEYEIYSGLRFQDRGVQQWTLDKKDPPNPMVEDWENSFFHKFKHCIDVYRSDVPEKDYEFWAVAFHDIEGKELFRHDADINEIKNFQDSKGDWIHVWREYDGPVPHSWSIWPYSTSKGWCNRLTGLMNAG